MGAAAEEHVTMVPASASLKPKGNYHDVGVSIGKDGERGHVRCEGRTLAVGGQVEK